MDGPINLFRSSESQAQYLVAFDATIQLWPVPHESRFENVPLDKCILFLMY